MTGKEVQYQINPAAADNADDFNGLLCTVTTAYNTTLKATVATLVDATVSNATVKSALDAADDLTTSTTQIASTKCYLTADTKFIYVYDKDTGTAPAMLTDMVVKTATGAQAVDASATNYIYYGTKATADTNYTVKYVVVKGEPVATVATSLMFVPQAFTTHNAVTYTNAAGVADTAYSNVAFIDGAPNQSILVTAAEAGTISTAGFYTYVKDATTGLYDLTAATTGFGMGTVANVYSSLVSYVGYEMSTDLAHYIANPQEPQTHVDVSAASAFIVDVPYLSDMLLNAGANGLTQITTLAGLLKTVSGAGTSNASFAFTWTTNASGAHVITGIYITAQPDNIPD
jgi:hypothetical protein